MKRLEELAIKVMELYQELENTQSSLPSCNGCRECCDTPSINIEATILEFLPLAIHLLKEGSIERWLKILETTDESGRCVLFDPRSEQGGCSYHSFRPLVCRLFSGSYILRKGRPEVWACRYLKPQLTNLSESLPECQKVHSKLLSIDFFLAQEKYPINIAFKKALEYTCVSLFPELRYKGA